MKLGRITSSSLISTTGTTKRWDLSPLLFSLYTNDCTSEDLSVKLLKFADDTRVICFIQDGNELAYRQEVDRLVLWCSQNHLELNPLKTVEMTVDFKRHPAHLPPFTILNTVPALDNFRFLRYLHFPEPEVGPPHGLHQEKGPAEVFLPVTAQEVQPAPEAADHLLHC